VTAVPPLLAHVGGGTDPWAWHAHPDVWLVVGALAGGYAWALLRLGPRLAPPGRPVATRGQVVRFALGVLAVWAFADWPAHDLGERFLFSVHMGQHTVFMLVAPPLLLSGTPEWLLCRLLSPRGVHAVVARLGRPLPAALLFNFLVVFTHWPPYVELTLRNEPVHFLAHAVLFAGSALMWFPVLNRLPGLPRLSSPAAMGYLFLQSVLPTVPASFLTFAERPLYRFYAEAPRPFAITAVEDQQLAGAIMKVVGGGILWAVIVVVFAQWYAREQRDQGDVLTWADVERELERTQPVGPARS
jgi:putative membrane protein